MATIEEKMKHAAERAERNAKIWRDFYGLRNQYPHESDFCLFETLAVRYRGVNRRLKRKLYPTTSMGVFHVMKRDTQYQLPKSRGKGHGDTAV